MKHTQIHCGKRFLKSRFFLSVLLCYTLFLSGCNGLSISNTEDDKLTVVTTLFPYYDFIRQVAGDNINLIMMLPAGMDTHSFEPTPSDMVTLQNADLFIYNGGELEAWVDSVMASIDTTELTIFNMLDYLESDPNTSHLLLDVEEQEEHHHEHDEHNIGKSNEVDEHIWTSPVIAQTMVSTIGKVLSLEDPEHEAEYGLNAENYIAQLEELDEQFRQVVADSPLSIMVFGDKFPFRYFTETYGLNYYAAFTSCSSEVEPGAATLSLLIDTVKEKKLPVVYYMELSSQKVADTICEETGATKLLFHSCHNVTAEELESGVTYLSIMQQNLENLKIGLLYKEQN